MSLETMVVIGLLVIFFCALSLMIWNAKRFIRKKTEENKKQEEEIRDIFAEIGSCFARQGFIFEYKINNGGEYSGRTFPTASGGYISIERYFSVGEYVILLRQSDNDAATLNNQKARAIIHLEILRELIYNRRSPNYRYFLKQDLLALKKTGVEQFVAGLVGLQREYDKIWSKLEVRRVPESFTTFFNLYDEDYTRFMNAIDLVVDENSPKVEVVKIEAPS